MKFTGDENHEISLEDASRLTANYRETLTSATEATAEAFGKSSIESLLAQTNCVGMRVYYGIDASNNKRLVLVGVDAEGNDLYEGELMENGTICPPCCSTSNPLNS